MLISDKQEERIRCGRWVAAATRWRWAGAARGPTPGLRKSQMVGMQVMFSGIVQEIGIICLKNTETL